MTPSAERSTDDLPERPRVLLVDDDEVNLLLTSVALQDQGFDVTEASGGEQAMRVLADWLPDIVVLDAVMPGLDGFETCRELRALPCFESLPVLMLTGLDDDASITRAYEAGATDFFVKSTQWSLLAGRLRYLLRASRTRHPMAISLCSAAWIRLRSISRFTRSRFTTPRPTLRRSRSSPNSRSCSWRARIFRPTTLRASPPTPRRIRRT